MNKVQCVASLFVSEDQSMKAKTEYVPLSSFEFKNTRIADSASHGDQAEKSFSHPNNNMYYEVSDIDENEN